MNPLDLHGPAFLLFYLAFGLFICYCLTAWIKALEAMGAQAPLAISGDPYLIAYLRAGPMEALKVATIALIDRGLLRSDLDYVSIARSDAKQLANRPIEREVLAFFQAREKAVMMFSKPAQFPSLKTYQKLLAENDLLWHPRIAGKRLLPVLVAGLALVGVAWIKITLALSQGHQNIGFLALLCALLTTFVLSRLFGRLTARGKALLADLQLLFARLKQRASSMKPGGQTNDTALLAAVFGTTLLPSAAFPFIAQLYPVATATTGGGDSSGDSGGSDGGGSSCGGGCGGGCGG